MATAATTPAPRAFALNVLAEHYYGLDLAVSVAGGDDRFQPQRLANVLIDTRGRQFFVQDCGHQSQQPQPPTPSKDSAVPAPKPAAAPRQQPPPAAPSCLSATLLGGGAAGGVGSGRLLQCSVDDSTAEEGGGGRPPSVQGSAYLNIELSGCYLTEGSVGLLDAGAGASVAGAWPFSSAPAAPVALVLGNYSTPAAGAAALGPVQILTPGSRALPLDADEAELAATRPTNVVIEGFAGLAPRLGRRSDAAHAGGGLLNVVADGKGRKRRAQGSVTRSQPSLVALDLNAPPAPSTLAVDTWDETRLAAGSGTSSSALQWSLTTMEELYGGSIRGQAFPIFDLSVCGTPVFGTRSSSWLAVIDTLDPCLTLPAQAFDTVRAWALNTSLPLADAGAGTDLCYTDAAGNYLCHLPASNLVDLASSLPALAFRLRQQQPGGNVNGEGAEEPALLTLPLSDLVMEPEPSNPNRTLCLIRGPELNAPVSPTAGQKGGAEKHVNVTFSDGSGSDNGSGGAIAGAAGAGRRRLQDAAREYQTNPIVLGTRALRSLYVVLDLENHRVGMANKAGVSLPPAGYGPGCAAPATCVGQGIYNPQRNLCEPPPCGRYMFQEPDPHDAHSCRFAFALACVLLVLAELLTHQWRTQASNAVVARKKRQRERRLAGGSNSGSRTGQQGGGLRRRVGRGATGGGGGDSGGAPAGAG